MLNHLKLTLRALQREKLYAAINIVGLAVATACVLIIGAHVYKELTYDRHIPNHEKVYRATIDLINGDDTTTFSLMSQFIAPALALDNPAIEGYVRFMVQPTDTLIRVRGGPSYWNTVYQTDDNVFAVFGHQAVYGDPRSALVDPGAVAVSNRFNQIHFNGENSLGEIITINDRDYRVSLVYEDQPENTHLKYDVLMSLNGLSYPSAEDLPRSLLTVNSYTYLVMPAHYEVERFSEFFDTFWAEKTGELLRNSGSRTAMRIVPVADVHYGPAAEYDQPSGNLFIVYA